MLAGLNLVEGSEVEISLSDAGIQIVPVSPQKEISRNLATWGSQYRAAIKAGDLPENDLFNGLINDFDSKEW
jgi:hypothetical protein